MKRHLPDSIRLTLSLAGIIGLGLLATACGTNTSSTSSRPQVRVWRVGQDADVIQDQVNEFLDQNKDIKYTYTKKTSLDGYEISALKSLTARKGPDVWSIPDDWLGDHLARLTPLPDNFFISDKDKNPPNTTDYVKTIYPAGITSQIINPIDQKVYGLPTGVDVLKLYYNPDLFDQAKQEFDRSLGDNADDSVVQPVHTLLSKAPETWSDVVDQVRYITKRNGSTITRAAIAMGTADNVPNSADLLQLLIMQNGQKITTDDHTRAIFHNPITTPAGVSSRPGENALAFLTSFSDPSKPTYTWNPSMAQALDAFGQGKVAMVIAFSDFGSKLKIKYPKFSFETTSVPQVSVAPLDPAVNLIRFWTETVTSVADNPIDALKVMRSYTLNPDSVAREAGLSSPLIKTLEGDKDSFPNKQVLTGKSVYKKNRDQFDAIFRQMITDVAQNGLTASQSIDGGADKINELLAAADE